MIDFIEGIVAGKAPGVLVISAGGVGFLLQCSNATLAAAPSVGERWRCCTVLNVREEDAPRVLVYLDNAHHPYEEVV